MLSIPLYIFLLLYLLFLAVFVSFMLIMLYHILSTGSLTMVSFFISFFVLASTVLILYGTSELLLQADIDWRQGVTLFNASWIVDAFGGVPDSAF